MVSTVVSTTCALPPVYYKKSLEKKLKANVVREEGLSDASLFSFYRIISIPILNKRAVKKATAGSLLVVSMYPSKYIIIALKTWQKAAT